MRGTRREVGRVSHKVRMHAPEGENANLHGQGQWTGGGEDRDIRAPTPPSAPEAKPHAKGNIQHAKPKGGQEETRGDNTIDGNGATPFEGRQVGISTGQSQTRNPTWSESGRRQGRQIRRSLECEASPRTRRPPDVKLRREVRDGDPSIPRRLPRRNTRWAATHFASEKVERGGRGRAKKELT